MSCLEKLSISGIRSFDPDNRQVIFFHPLTIILGINGAGKTTIIECLRYIASNEFPPNSKQGKTWIHEAPKKKSHTVRAQVKLAFRDVHQEECVVTKSFQMTTSADKNGKLTSRIRTLDAIIKRGDNTLVSSKCADINSIILELIGVSKAVITNVIFCHQEDSNWPLSEGKVLKEKFDEIFGSIGYVKALKRIKDLRTEYCKLQTISEGEFRLYSEQKSQVEKYEAELAKNETTLASHKSAINSLNQELVPLQKNLEAIILKEQALIEIERVISKLTGQLNEQQKTYNYLKSNIKEKFFGTEEELCQVLAEFKNNLKLKIQKQELAESNLDTLQQQLKLLKNEETNLILTKTKLDHCQKNYFKSLNLQNETIVNVMADDSIIKIAHYLDLNIQQNHDNQSKLTLNLLSNISHYLQLQAHQVKEEFKIKLDQIDQKLDDHKSTKSKLEQSLKMNQHSAYSANQEVVDLSVKLKAIDNSNTLVESLKKQIKKYNQELNQLESEIDVNELNSKIVQLKAFQDQIKSEIENLNKEKDRLQFLSENQAVFNVLKSNRSKEEENLNLIYSQNVLIMTELAINEMDFTKSFCYELQIIINRLNQSITIMENKLESLINDRQIIEHDFNLKKMKLDSLKKDVKFKENKIKSFCNDDDYEMTLEELNKEVKVLREKKSNYLGSKAVLIDYCNIIKKEDKCPVCCQDIFEDIKKSSIINQLKIKIEQVPEQTKSIVKKLEKKEQLYNQLLGLASDNQFVKNSKQEISDLYQTVSLLESQLSSLCSNIEEVNKELKKKKFELKKFKSLESDAIKYDHSIETIIKLDKQINDLKGNMYTSGNVEKVMDNEKSLDNIKQELEVKNSQFKKLEKDLSQVQEIKEDFSQKLSQLNQKIIIIEKEKLDLEKNLQKSICFQDKIEDLKKKLFKFDKAVVKDSEDLETVKLNLNQFNQTKNQLLDEQKFKLNEINFLMQKVDKYQKQLETIMKEIDEYVDQNIDSKLSEFTKKLNQIKSQSETIIVKIEDETKMIKKYLIEINEAEVKERDLKDNLALMKCSHILSEYNEQLKLEVEKRGSQDSLGLLKKKQELEKLCSEKCQKVQHLKGRQEPIILKNKEIRQDMSKEKYKSAKENYRRKKLDLVVTKMLCDDLNKYYKALDHSVMIYHNKKMEEINRLVFKLWKQTYRGTDIDHIKIVSDENDERSAEDKRKTFNYRVVMVKNGHDMDMRGRCSAGQKVIASLVIRLALAEIFCINCGVLALDEPTTNLDGENIRAFADAVIDIVESHRFHRFQLLIITHDEQFLRCLNESSNEFYYKVEKDEDGFSKITRYSIRERDE